MKIDKLNLNNFRNYETAEVEFDKGINFIVGDNAQGKTNMLESIYFCALGKSPKNVREKQLIRFNQQFAKIDLNYSTLAGKKNVKIAIYDNNKKNVKINNVSILKLSQMVGEFMVVYFSPDELKLVKEVPQDRRRFLDISISQFDKNYLNALIKYDRVLKQRNCILKSNTTLQSKKEQIELFTPQLINLAEIIIKKRLYFVEKLQENAQNIHNKLTNNETLNLKYSYKLKENKSIREDLLFNFENNLQKEIELGYTIFGPHRDDLIFEINNKDCRYFSSQGQQRTIALTLKLALMEIIFNETKEYPVLLLDDVLSELDDYRQNKLLECVKKYQTLITCTQKHENLNFRQIHVANGKILV